jgi:hypothetical protein
MMTITDNDRKIVAAVSTLDISTVDLLAYYLPRHPKAIARRLPLLLKAKEIFALRRGSSDKYVYAARDITRRSPFTLEHDLMISWIHAVLRRANLLENDRWTQGKAAWSTVHPDAFTTLEAGRKLDLYIEADNGTMNFKDMGAKIQTYLEHFKQTPFPFKVLFVTTSEKRAQNLAKLAEEFVSKGARKGYLFTTIDQFKADPLGVICYRPHDSTPQSILPVV